MLSLFENRSASFEQNQQKCNTFAQISQTHQNSSSAVRRTLVAIPRIARCKHRLRRRSLHTSVSAANTRQSCTMHRIAARNTTTHSHWGLGVRPCRQPPMISRFANGTAAKNCHSLTLRRTCRSHCLEVGGRRNSREVDQTKRLLAVRSCKPRSTECRLAATFQNSTPHVLESKSPCRCRTVRVRHKFAVPRDARIFRTGYLDGVDMAMMERY